MQIHQILPTLSYGDAIGDEVLEIRGILKSWGYKSEIYAQFIHPKMSNTAKPWTDYKKISSPENILIFHFSNGSDVSRFVKILPDKKIIRYHNITPPEYFKGINDTLFLLLSNGRIELKEFANITDLALGDSEYNRKELIELGFKNTGVLPIIINFDKYIQKPDQKIINKFEDDYINLIFVGRLAPNKKQEDIIKIFYYFNKCINPRSRLFLVGAYNGMEKYYAQLKDLITRLNLKNVHITGHVNFKELLAYYKLADIFISMSEHEGFCVPLLESMHFEIPIIAYNSTAIPYTLNGSGVLVNEKQYDEIAEIINILVNDDALREKITKKQSEHFRNFDAAKIKERLNNYIEPLLH